MKVVDGYKKKTSSVGKQRMLMESSRSFSILNNHTFSIAELLGINNKKFTEEGEVFECI